jgi:hypothetical protein
MLRRFFSLLVEQELLGINPANRIPMYPEYGVEHYLETDELMCLLNQTASCPKGFDDLQPWQNNMEGLRAVRLDVVNDRRTELRDIPFTLRERHLEFEVSETPVFVGRSIEQY